MLLDECRRLNGQVHLFYPGKADWLFLFSTTWQTLHTWQHSLRTWQHSLLTWQQILLSCTHTLHAWHQELQTRDPRPSKLRTAVDQSMGRLLDHTQQGRTHRIGSTETLKSLALTSCHRQWNRMASPLTCSIRALCMRRANNHTARAAVIPASLLDHRLLANRCVRPSNTQAGRLVRNFPFPYSQSTYVAAAKFLARVQPQKHNQAEYLHLHV